MKENLFFGEIDNIYWNKNNNIIIEGYYYIKNHSQYYNSSVKKSLIIENGSKRYMIPFVNVDRSDVFENEEKDFYKMSGFYAVLDVGYIDNKDSLSFGKWNLKVNIISDGIEAIKDLKINESKVDLNKIGYKEIVNKHNKCSVIIKPIIENGYLCFISSKHKDLKHINYNNSPKVYVKKGFKSCFIYLKKAFVVQLYNLFKKLPVKNDKILFLSESRTDLSGNFKFVYDEIKHRGDYNTKIILNNPKNLSLKNKAKWVYDIATSKYILLDDFYPMIYDFDIREDAELIQLWHACGAFKTFGFSRMGKEGGPKMRSNSHRNYTKAIVSSENIRKFYAEGFGISEDKVFATGIPRTDIFFDNKYIENKKNEIINKYPILKNKKVIMFAPTFRGKGKGSAYYDFNKLDLDKMYKSFSDEYVFILKLHPFIKNIPEIDEKYKDFVIDLSAEREINDLLFVSDVLITDYSSVCFEFSLLNKPMIFFAYDMEDYIEKRDFYYPYKEFVPGVIAKTTDEMIEIIKTENYDKEKLNKFRNTFFKHFDGKSTERVVDLILK